MKYKKRIFLMIAGIVALGTLSINAHAKEYPSKPITIIVPYGTGGAADLAARIMAKEMPEYLGAKIMVVNKTGAGGVVGSNFVARSKPDGYTLLMARVGSQAAVPAINKTIPYKWDDFTMLGVIEKNPFVLGISAKSEYKTFEDLRDAIKSGKKLTYTSGGVGTLLHISVLVLLEDLGVNPNNLTHIPFKGGGKATAAVVGGHADLIFHNLSGLSGAIKSKQIIPLLTTTPKRFPAIPNTPTAAEKGLPNLENIIGWTGVWAPKNLPADVVNKWTKALSNISKDASWIETTERLGSVPTVMSPADTKVFVRGQVQTFEEVAKKLNLIIK